MQPYIKQMNFSEEMSNRNSTHHNNHTKNDPSTVSSKKLLAHDIFFT